MPDAIDNVAQLFQGEMTGKAPPAGGQPARSVEGIFGQSDNVENANEPAGGDATPVPGEKPRKEPRSREREEDLELEDEEEDEDEAGEEADDEEDADEEDDQDRDEEDPDPVLSKKYDIVVDGEEVTVSLREALKGY